MKWLLAALIVLSSVTALAGLSEMNVVVFPDIASQTFQYDFVFSDVSNCNNVLLNDSMNITTNPAGRGNATLNLTSLSQIPTYLCTYRDGVLKNTQSLNRNAFEQGNITSTNGIAGYVPLYSSATNLVSWILSSSLLNATGFDAANLTSGLVPDARISSTFNNQSIGISINGSATTTITNSPLTASGTINIQFSCANSSQNGTLCNADWSTFNNKAASGSSAACTYGIANYTLTSAGMAVTCATQQGNVSGTGLNGTVGYHVYQTSATALATSNLSETSSLLSYPNSLLIDGGTIKANATSNYVGINTTNPTSTLDIVGNVSITGNLQNYAGIFVNGSPVGNVSGSGSAGNITYWVNSSTLGSIAVGPAHLNNTTTGVVGQIPMFASATQFTWTNITNITIITATGATNWNKPAGAEYAAVFICGGGGGGSGGNAAAQGAIRSGGGGGGGGMCVTKTFNIADLTDPVVVTIGSGGVAVAAGLDGNAGTSSTFGSYITAFGGGAGGNTAGAGGGGGGGGGCATVGTSSTTGTGGTGGACMIAAVAANTASVHGGGAGGGTAGVGVVNGPNAWLAGAGGGTSTTAGGAAGGAGGSSQYSAAGGGGGGGVNAASPGTVQNGGAGGNTGTNVIAAGGGGSAGTGAGVCGGAGDGQPGNSGFFGEGGQGGGGGGSKAAAATSGCTGGTGGAFGGGGGGGGGGTTGGVGGAGGKGGDGGAIIIAW